MTTVLCTNGLQSKTLATVRSLGSRGIKVIVGEKELLHTSGFSKYAYKSLVYPDPKKHPDQFYEWCLETVIREECDVLLAMDDDVMAVLVPRQEEIQRYCHVPLPNLASYQVAADKAKTIALAQQLGISHPKTVEPKFADTVNIRALIELTSEFEFPVVIKPRNSSGSRGIRYVSNMDELVSLYPEIHNVYPNSLIQEAVPNGSKLDIGLCYGPNGNLYASFIQREIRNYPISRGPSTVRESTTHPELLAYATKLMTGVPWYGVVDVEFMIDPRTQKPMLMEINPRFWSSLHLAIVAGVDFPYLIFQLAMDGTTEVVDHYREGVMSRSIFPGDILHFISNRNRMRMVPSFFTTHIPDDIISRSDMRPTLGFLLSALRNAVHPSMWKFLINR